ncbi:glutamine amidotransferase [Paraburkholderia sp. J12]|uniref:glutamine amidotransferase n=1 Tax=Paraburkholderia sp. J12 TaxID=2805432 RepID=UPI002ABD5223|nr:glutamine amidotransferase [Paraburkholderia sp. J12]
MIRRVDVIRHVHFEDLGSLQAVLSARSSAIRYLNAGIDDLTSIGDDPPDLLVVMGGPLSANDEHRYPWLTPMLRILEQRVAVNRPTLGICLGAQLLARVLGAAVRVGQSKEIGWSPVTLTEAGLRSPMRHFSARNAPVLHWHGETFDLPPGATLLGSTEAYRNQAFSRGPNLLGLQCHVEVQQPDFERWLIGHAGELSGIPSISINGLRADAIRYCGGLELAATAMFNEWLDALV